MYEGTESLLALGRVPFKANQCTVKPKYETEHSNIGLGGAYEANELSPLCSQGAICPKTRLPSLTPPIHDSHKAAKEEKKT